MTPRNRSLGSLVALGPAALGLWRLSDLRGDARERRRLRSLQPPPRRFDPACLEGLPEPVRRFFRFAIAPGAPIRTVAEIEMAGLFGPGPREAPGYLPMRARQVLAAPHGFIWSMMAGAGVRRLSGSDSGHWTRFWLAGLLPVARRGGNPDHRRSAFGRMVAEAAFWTPAALLPRPGITLSAPGPDLARVRVSQGADEQEVDLALDRDGRLREVRFLRWSDANPQRRFCLQPFGGYASAFRRFDGYCLPTHVEAGNGFGTSDYFPFFVVDVRALRFPPGAAAQT